MTRSALALAAALGVSLAVQAQVAQPRPTPRSGRESPRAEDAHKALSEATVDRAKEAARLTESLAKEVAGRPGAGRVPRRTFIDRLIFDRIERDRVPHAGLATDEDLVRRIYIDAIGLPPPPDAVRAFAADRAPDKAAKLIDALVGTEEFAEQWAWFWTDLLRISSEAGTGRRAFSFWLKEQFKSDRPYDEFVHDLLTPSTKAHATVPALAFIGRANQLKSRFVHSADDFGIHNRLDALDQVNVDVHRAFLGINTSCVSCHDGANHLEQVNLFLTRKTREEFYRMSAFLGRTRMIGNWDDKTKNVVQDLHIDDLAKGYNTADDAPFYTMAESQFPRLEGKTYRPAFLLTGEEPRPGLHERAELARMVTTHPQFARATVNLVWGRLMTVAFVEPFDAFDLDRLDPKNPPPAPWTVQPTYPALLDAVADDFRKSGHSLHHLIKTIMKSSAYQLSARFPGAWDDKYTTYYPRKFIRILTGPEIIDTIAAVTDNPTDIAFSGKTTRRVKQLVGPEDLGRRGGGGAIDALMQSFYQSNRRTPPPEGNKASTLQAMLMMRSTVVNDRVLASSKGRIHALVSSDLTPDRIVEEIFVTTLARRPTAEEAAVARRAVEADRTAGAENLQWALFNLPEFLTNH
ncbi:MAG: DUF1549 domain-containing protein [Acidobacteriota bacterium]